MVFGMWWNSILSRLRVSRMWILGWKIDRMLSVEGLIPGNALLPPKVGNPMDFFYVRDLW
jgi:hypothetical protein